MQLFKENKVLIIWLAIAYAVAFSSFGRSKINSNTSSNEVEDSLIYFSFSKDQQDNIATFFERKFDKNGFNGVVLIGQKDSIFFSQSYGYADYKTRDTLNLNSTFQLASVSKQFAAVAILQLYERGLLNITDSVQKFYPDFPYKGITIEQLLSHRSGIANYIYFMQFIPTTYDTLLSNQNIVNELIEKQPKSYYRPNQRYHYSNTGYALLAAIIEKVSGLSYTEYLHKYIFSPLQMESTYTFIDKLNGIEHYKTTGYLNRWREAEDNYLDGVLGDKGIYSSVIDLFKWDQGLYKNIIINVDTLALAFEPTGKPDHFQSNYGYGWRMFNWKNDSVKVLFHGGWWHGYKTLLMHIPNDSTTIVVLKNRSKGASINSKHLLQILYPETINSSDTLEFEHED